MTAAAVAPRPREAGSAGRRVPGRRGTVSSGSYSRQRRCNHSPSPEAEDSSGSPGAGPASPRGPGMCVTPGTTEGCGAQGPPGPGSHPPAPALTGRAPAPLPLSTVTQVPVGGGGRQRLPGAPSRLPAVGSSRVWVWVPGIGPWAGRSEVGQRLDAVPPAWRSSGYLPSPSPQIGKG